MFIANITPVICAMYLTEQNKIRQEKNKPAIKTEENKKESKKNKSKITISELRNGFRL